MIKKNKKNYILVIAVIAVIISFIVFKKQNSDNYIEYTVVKQDISDELLLAGTIDAERRVDLGFANSGRIKKINFSIGDMVKKGDVNSCRYSYQC
jgi:multidrug efflux pump subunit AcrA (membrane-fusion protein)